MTPNELGETTGRREAYAKVLEECTWNILEGGDQATLLTRIQRLAEKELGQEMKFNFYSLCPACGEPQHEDPNCEWDNPPQFTRKLLYDMTTVAQG